MTIAKKIALITGGNIHKEERETPLSSLGRRQRARHRQVAYRPGGDSKQAMERQSIAGYKAYSRAVEMVSLTRTRLASGRPSSCDEWTSPSVAGDLDLRPLAANTDRLRWINKRIGLFSSTQDPA